MSLTNKREILGRKGRSTVFCRLCGDMIYARNVVPIPVYEPLRDIPVLLHIQDKQKQLVPFVPNKMQADYLPRKTRRNIILKARQMGFSVGELADNMLRTIFVPGTNYAIVSHDETLARNLLVDFVRPWLKQLESYGLCPTIGRSNENEITFPNIKSSIRILSSKGDSPGRGTPTALSFYR